MTLSQIQGNISAGNYLVQKQSDFQASLYSYPRDTRVGLKQVYAGKSNEITFNNILPATLYRVCGYYQNSAGTVSSSSRVCESFTTPNSTWPVYKAVINFNLSLGYDKRNTMLCYFYNQVGGSSYNLLDERGEACNNSSQWFRYQGSTANAWNSETVYLVTQDSGYNGSQPAASFLNMFSNNSLTSAQGSALSSAVGVTVLNSSYAGFSSHAYMRARN